jgi:hypothetical protein
MTPALLVGEGCYISQSNSSIQNGERGRKMTKNEVPLHFEKYFSEK